MPRVIIEPSELQRLIRRRRACGGDRYDEVWNGVYVMSPLADNEHQHLASEIAFAVRLAVGHRAGARVLVGTNVSDQPEKWRKNYRCPDVAVFLPGNPAEDRGTHWLGGPDFAVEVISPYDRTRLKLPFYAKVGTRELLLLDRKPWRLELYRPEGGTMVLVGTSEPGQPAVLASAVLPLTFRLVTGQPRPRVEVACTAEARSWLA